MNVAHLSRLIENLIRIGTVIAVDHAAARCRVASGKLESQWLPWIDRRAGNTRTWEPPTVGEQVLILSPSGDPAAGVVLIGLFCDAHAAPSASASEHVATYPDGARIAYDHASGALTATGIQTATIQAAVSVTLDTPATHITGDVQIDGTCTVADLLTYGNGIAGTGGANANIITGDFVQTAGQLSSNGIVLATHTHTGVVPGGGNTGGPQ
jgi:phage baseplate assembly protein V